MSMHSEFWFQCLCSREFRAQAVGIFRCSECGRLLELQWTTATQPADSSAVSIQTLQRESARLLTSR